MYECSLKNSVSSPTFPALTAVPARSNHQPPARRRHRRSCRRQLRITHCFLTPWVRSPVVPEILTLLEELPNLGSDRVIQPLNHAMAQAHLVYRSCILCLIKLTQAISRRSPLALRPVFVSFLHVQYVPEM